MTISEYRLLYVFFSFFEGERGDLFWEGKEELLRGKSGLDGGFLFELFKWPFQACIFLIPTNYVGLLCICCAQRMGSQSQGEH